MGVTEAQEVSRGGRLRLTRRGRAVITILLLLLVAAAAAVLSPASRAADPGSRTEDPEAPVAVVVRPGDSLWSLAERHRPDRDPLVVVDEIRRLNGMDGYLVSVGQRLLVPTDR